MTKRRAVECRAHALLVHRMAGLVHCREQRITEIVLAYAGGDADVASREPRAERMMRLVEAAAVEIVAHALRHLEAELELRRLAEALPQAVIVRRCLLRDGPHDRHELAP